MLAICTCVHVQNSQYVLSQCIDHATFVHDGITE